MRPKMQLHELHPAIVHAPLTLLPAAAAADLTALRAGDAAWERVGRRFWAIGTASAVLAGVAGLAASQQVRLGEPRARDMTFVHGMGNLAITATALGLAAWRRRRPPTPSSVGVGLVACGLALYTATLGGKMVYEYGVGINPMPADAPQGTLRGPALLSRAAPAALVRDAGRGLRWLVTRLRDALRGREPIAPGTSGVTRAASAPYETPGAPTGEEHAGAAARTGRGAVGGTRTGRRGPGRRLGQGP